MAGIVCRDKPMTRSASRHNNTKIASVRMTANIPPLYVYRIVSMPKAAMDTVAIQAG